MFGRKKEAPKEGRKGGGEALLNQMGFMDMSAMDAMIYGDDDDEELEAELLALQGQTSPAKTSPKKAVQNMAHLDRMVADSMRDIPSDEDVSDTEDPDLLAELNELSNIPDEPESPSKMSVEHVQSSSNSSNSLIETLEERLAVYLSVLDVTKANGESSKVRRIERGIKTLQDLVKKARSGRPVAEDDIPPPLAASNKTSPTSPAKPPLSAPAAPELTATFAPTLEPGPSPNRRASAGSALTLQPGPAPARRASAGYAPTLEPGQPLIRRGSSPARRPAPPPPPQTSSASNLTVAALSTPTATPSKPPPPKPPTSSPSHHSLTGQDAENHKILSDRRDQFKLAAMRSKQAGYGEMAFKYLKTAKQFDRVIQALEEGKPIDLSQMPPPPPGFSAPAVAMSIDDGIAVDRASTQGSVDKSQDSTPDDENLPALTAEDKQKLYSAPTSAGSVHEALKQRLDKYKSAEEEALKENNKSKAKRMGRIVKQYEEAIKAYKAGKPVAFDELPSPPGYPPIPVPPSAVRKEQVVGPVAISGALASTATIADTSIAGGSPARATHTTESADQPRVSPAQAKTAPPPPAPAKQPGLNRQTSLLSRSEQQTLFLQERQLQFKKAAFQAKKNGDIELAKKYLRMAKGFDQMIEAAASGLPVDMSQVPPLPGTENEDFEFVPDPSEIPEDAPEADRETMYKTLEQELINQIKTCTTNAEHFTHLGDVSSAAKFDKMGQNARKDLDTLKNAYKHGDPVPRFHYETRTFTLVQSCTDMGDNDLELTVVRGINLALPSDYNPNDLDTYIKYEFPFPNDGAQKGSTDTVKGSNNPEYNHVAKLNINRKARSFLRLLKSNKNLKLEIYYKRGFFKGDKVLGTAYVKLQPLESKCILHDCYDLSEGRKVIGGKLEIKIRVRDPFVSKHVEEVKEKWLVIDVFDRALTEDPSSGSIPVISMEVMKYEKQLLDRQIQKLAGKLSKSEEMALKHKSELLNERIEEQKFKLRQGGVQALKEYVDMIESAKMGYLQEAQQLVKQGNREKAQVVLNKKKCLEREVEAIRSKLGPVS